MLEKTGFFNEGTQKISSVRGLHFVDFIFWEDNKIWKKVPILFEIS